VTTSDRSTPLYRTTENRVLAGVAGGLGNHFGVDPTWVRAAFAAAMVPWGAGLVIYAVLWIMLPEEPAPGEAAVRAPLATEQPRMVAGIALICLGLVLLWWKVLVWLSFKIVLPVAFIAMGIFLVRHRGSWRREEVR